MPVTAPDHIFFNGHVYTVNQAAETVEAFAVTNGRISALGTNSEVTQLADTGTEQIDLQGAFVMPGLVDAHNHHFEAGKEALFQLQLPIGAGLAEILAAVSDYAANLPADAWVVGGPWASDRLAELNTHAAFQQLDAAAQGRPVVLIDDSHHNRWANASALAAANIQPGSQGVLLDDDGEPTGVLLEAAGLPLARLTHTVAGLTETQERQAAAQAIDTLNSFGVTAFQDAGVSTHIMRALHSLDGAQQLNAWVVSSMLINDDIFGFADIGTDLVFQGEQFRSAHHRPDFVKIFLDGVPPTHSGAFLEPYLPTAAHGCCYRGETIFTPAELTGWLRKVAGVGLSAKIHCTGDASVRAVLDAVATLREEGFTTTRYHVAHGQFVHPDDIPRFAQLGVDAEISPFIWVPGPISEAISHVLPADRAERMQPNRALLDAGATVAGGSDWPVSPSPNPWEGIHGLVTRQDPHGIYPGTLWPEQAISLAEAIRVFTLNGAQAIGLGDETGSLEVGKSADFIRLNRNPFAHEMHELIGTEVVETWFAGTRVWNTVKSRL